MIEFIRNICLIFIVCFVVTISFHLMNKKVDFPHGNTIHSSKYMRDAASIGEDSDNK